MGLPGTDVFFSRPSSFEDFLGAGSGFGFAHLCFAADHFFQNGSNNCSGGKAVVVENGTRPDRARRRPFPQLAGVVVLCRGSWVAPLP